MKPAVLVISLLLIAGISAAANASSHSSSVFKIEGVCTDGNSSGVNQVDSYGGVDSAGMVEFTGSIEASTPCQEVNHSVTQNSENNYTLNVETIPVNSSSRTACVQCTGEVRYMGFFRAEQPFQLNILHTGETVETVESGDFGGQDRENTTDPSNNSSAQSVNNSTERPPSNENAEDQYNVPQRESTNETGLEDGSVMRTLKGFMSWLRNLF